MEQRIKKEGGMREKYGRVIDLIMKQDPRCVIRQETASYINVELYSSGTTTLFELLATFRSVTITYRVLSPIFGEHKLEWEFFEDDD